MNMSMTFNTQKVFCLRLVVTTHCFTNSVHHGVFTEVVKIDTACQFALSISTWTRRFGVFQSFSFLWILLEVC